jgi:hypothetical protein
VNEKSAAFPIGTDFLEITNALADACGKKTDEFFISAGRQLPQTVKELGTMLSILYRLGCCHYGCRGGDHQIEWLIVKFYNQAISAYQLIRTGQYDEALTLIRGAGEIANLFWLFHGDTNELVAWQAADNKARMRRFRPGAVGDRLKKLPIGSPIDDRRYSALCEVGTHPTPSQIPGHFSGTGRGELGAILQEAGVFVCINELALAVAMAVPVGKLLDAKPEIRKELKKNSVDLLRAAGSFTILNYEDQLSEARGVKALAREI